jgi:hypothetical protein
MFMHLHPLQVVFVNAVQVATVGRLDNNSAHVFVAHLEAFLFL